MKRSLVVLALAGCGEDVHHGVDAPTPIDAAIDVPIDAPKGTNLGFTPPADVLAAWTSPSQGTFTPVPIDLACHDTPYNDPPTTIPIALTVTVNDFQAGTAVAGAPVSAFAVIDRAHPFATATTDGAGHATLTVPAGQQRIGFEVTAASAMDTLFLERVLAPSTGTQLATIPSLSNATGATLPALVGETRIPGSATVLGVLRDCQQHEVSNFIATVSSVPAIHAHLPGAETFYFSDSVDLPVHHNQAPAGTRDGVFMVIQVPPTTVAYVQAWGFVNAADLASGTLRMVAEVAVPLVMDSAVRVDQDPHATH